MLRFLDESVDLKVVCLCPKMSPKELKRILKTHSPHSTIIYLNFEKDKIKNFFLYNHNIYTN